MTLWIIEPRDPVMLRDGRPFGLAPGARARSLEFPFPSTTTGAARQQIGLGKDPSFPLHVIKELREVAVRGPLLVELVEKADGDAVEFLAPAPADAVLLAAKPGAKEVNIHRLVPQRVPDGSFTDLHSLAPLSMVNLAKDKPAPAPPRFWRWDVFRDWLSDPKDRSGYPLNHLGHRGPHPESRVHVTILPDQQTAEEGHLFQTNGLEFLQRTEAAPQPLGLALEMEADFTPGFATLGGERRLVRWRKLTEESLPACPSGLRQAIIDHAACRVVLLTPAMFEHGFRPQSLLSLIPNLDVKLVSAAVGRPQVVSGWDYATEQAKPSRRLAPAGSVYFLKFGDNQAAIGAFVDRVWMQCVSDGIVGQDEGQDNRDGFGLAVVGVWPEGKDWKEEMQ